MTGVSHAPRAPWSSCVHPPLSQWKHAGNTRATTCTRSARRVPTDGGRELGVWSPHVGADLGSARAVHDTGTGVLLRRHGPQPQRAEHADDDLLLRADRAVAVARGRLLAGPGAVRQRLHRQLRLLLPEG